MSVFILYPLTEQFSRPDPLRIQQLIREKTKDDAYTLADSWVKVDGIQVTDPENWKLYFVSYMVSCSIQWLVGPAFTATRGRELHF